MGNRITVIYGTEQVEKIAKGQPLALYQIKQFVKTYDFQTSAEAKAFESGIQEAVGWMEVYILNSDKREPTQQSPT